MTATRVTSQQELDEALARGDEEIVIDSPQGVWLRLESDGKSTVSIRGRSCVGPVWGSASVSDVRDRSMPVVWFLIALSCLVALAAATKPILELVLWMLGYLP